MQRPVVKSDKIQKELLALQARYLSLSSVINKRDEKSDQALKEYLVGLKAFEKEHSFDQKSLQALKLRSLRTLAQRELHTNFFFQKIRTYNEDQVDSNKEAEFQSYCMKVVDYINIFATDQYSNTPLHAILSKRLDNAVATYLKQGASLFAVNNVRLTPVQLMLLRKDLFTRLAEEDCLDFSQEDDLRCSILHVLSGPGNSSLLPKLFSCTDADPNVKGPNGFTPLHLAFMSENSEGAFYLLNHPQVDLTITDTYGKSPVDCFLVNINFLSPQVVELMLKLRPELRSKVGRLSPIDISIDDIILPEIAVKPTTSRNDTVVGLPTKGQKTREQKTIDPQVQDEVYRLIKKDKLKDLKKLLTKKADVCDLDRPIEGYATPLMFALDKHNYPLANLLCEYGADATIVDSLNQSALQIACRNNHDKSVEMLLAHGADPNQEVFLNIEGKPYKLPVIYAVVSNGSFEMITALMRAGARIDICSPEYPGTPLHNAILLGNTPAVKAFLEGGANIHKKDVSGNTPWHCAAGTRCSELLYLLGSYGAYLDIFTTNAKGITPFALATDCQNGCFLRAFLFCAMKDAKTKLKDAASQALKDHDLTVAVLYDKILAQELSVVFQGKTIRFVPQVNEALTGFQAGVSREITP